jgi:hypothetical protein
LICSPVDVTGRTFPQRSGIFSIALSFTICLGGCRHSSQTPDDPKVNPIQLASGVDQ